MDKGQERKRPEGQRSGQAMRLIFLVGSVNVFFNRSTEDTDENRSDRVGLFDRFTPKFAKSYLNLSELLLKALATFREEVLMQTKTYHHPDSYGSFLSGKRGTHEKLRTFREPTFAELNGYEKKGRWEVKGLGKSRG